MNTQKNNNDNFTVNAKTAVIFAICVAGLLFVARFDAIKDVFGWIASLLMPIFVGTMTAYILNPLTVFFESRLRQVCFSQVFLVGRNSISVRPLYRLLHRCF